MVFLDTSPIRLVVGWFTVGVNADTLVLDRASARKATVLALVYDDDEKVMLLLIIEGRIVVDSNSVYCNAITQIICGYRRETMFVKVVVASSK